MSRPDGSKLHQEWGNFSSQIFFQRRLRVAREFAGRGFPALEFRAKAVVALIYIVRRFGELIGKLGEGFLASVFNALACEEACERVDTSHSGA
jgi:hypothetical protein